MSKDFIMQFSGLALTVGQPIAYQFQDKKLLGLVVKGLEAVDPSAAMSDVVEVKKTVFGRLLGNSTVQFEKAESSSVNLTGKAKGFVFAIYFVINYQTSIKSYKQFSIYSKIVRQSIINPDWDFGKMGIGGLDKEFNAIFRRAFASRVFPPELVEQLGCKHVKGILLYGPPGMCVWNNENFLKV